MKYFSFLLIAFPSLLFSQSAFFEPFNGPFSANVSVLSRDRSGMLYVGTSSAGIYKSTDAGVTWTPASDGLTNLSVASIFIAADNTVYVGTSNEQVFVSTNSGVTWSERTGLIPKGLFNATYGGVTSFAEPRDGLLYGVSSANGLFVSRDRANSWRPVGFAEYIQTFAANSKGDLFIRSGGALYKSRGDSSGFLKVSINASTALTALTVAEDNTVFIAAKNVLYRSDDDGNTWRVICQAGPMPSASPSIQLIKVSTNGTIDFSFGGTIYRSTDNGTTWQQTASYDHTSATTSGIIDEGRLLAATRQCGIFRSDDGGQSWSLSNNGMSAQEVRKFIMTKDQVMVAVLGSRALFSRAKNAAEWTNMKGPSSASMILAITSDHAGTFYVGTAKGVYRSTNGGGAWDVMDTVSLPYPVRCIIADTVNQNIYALTQSDGLYKMNISGTSWTLVANTDALKFGELLKISPMGTLFYSGNQSVYRSTDGGVTWKSSLQIDNFQANDMLFPALGQISVLAGNKLYTSTDDGVTFSAATMGEVFNGRAMQQMGPKKLFVGTSNGLMRSTDKGKSWTVLSSGLLNPAINTVTIDAENFLLVGTDAGVYRSVAAEQNYYFNTESLSFGIQRVGTVRTDSVVIHNKTAKSMSITSLFVKDTAFSVQASSATVLPNDSVTVSVRFSPSMVKAYNASLVFVHSFGKDSIALTGTGKAPILSFPQKEILFGNVLSGKDQSSKDLQIKNMGNDTLIVAGISSSHPYFSVPQDTFRVNPGAFFLQKLFFKPETSGVFHALLIYHSNSIRYTDTLTLTGAGYLKAIGVFQATALDFGKVRVDTARSLTISIRNDGNDTLRIQRDDSAAVDIVSKRELILVAPGAVYQDTVTMKSIHFGTITTSFAYRLLNDSTRQTIAIRGYGYAQASPVYSPQRIDAGVIAIGAEKDTSIRITNAGSDTLVVLRRLWMESDKVLNLRIPPGGTAIDTVAITLSGYGYRTMRCFYYTNAYNSPDTVVVTAFGTGKPAITFYPASGVNCGSVAKGVSKKIPFYIFNSGGDTLKVTNAVSINPKFSISRKAFTIIPGGSYLVDTVVYTPTVIGSDTGAIVYYSNTAKVVDTLVVFGVGNAGSFIVKHASFTDQELHFVAIARNGNIIAGTKNGIFYSLNSGNSWNKSLIGDTVLYVGNIIVLPNGYMLASSATQGILRSTDNGVSWVKITSQALFSYVQSVQRSGDGTLFALQADRYSSKSRLVSSVDHGETWSEYPCGLLSTSLYDEFIISKSGVMYLNDYTPTMPPLLRSIDQGRTWQPIQTGTGASIFAVCREAEDGTIFGKMVTGGVAASSDSGKTWRTLYAGGYISDIWAVSDSIFYLLTSTQPMMRSLNGGAAWENIPQELTTPFTVPFCRHYDGRLWWGDPTGLYASREPIGAMNKIETVASPIRIGTVPVNTDGIIVLPLFNTTDDTVSCLNHGLSNPRFRFSYHGRTIPPHALITDTVLYSPASESLDSCAMTIETTVGVTSVVMYGKGKVVTSVERKSSASIKYALYQNYPNPFNPTTTIGYQVPTTAHVSLKIFDVLGREVMTLVNEERNAGIHTVQWNAAGFRSGVYYYRLQAGSFTEARKFILLK